MVPVTKMSSRLSLAMAASHGWRALTEKEHLASRSMYVSTDAKGANISFVGDLDGDEDMDVLVASGCDKCIVWYETIIFNGLGIRDGCGYKL